MRWLLTWLPTAAHAAPATGDETFALSSPTWRNHEVVVEYGPIVTWGSTKGIGSRCQGISL